MSDYPMRFTGWQPSAEGGRGATEWELPQATCPRTKAAVPAEEVAWEEHRYDWGVVYLPKCKRCYAFLTEQAYPLDPAEQAALRAIYPMWKGLR